MDVLNARASHGPGRFGRSAVTFLRHALACAALLAACAPAARAQMDVRITAVEPARTDSTLECVVRTSGLPDARSRETLASGLPSSLTLAVTVLDGAGRERGTTLAEVRIEPDPWERSFVVRTPVGRQRAASMEELAVLLRTIGPLPLPRTTGFDARRPGRVRVRLAVHALAPAEADRAHALFVGDVSGNGGERREVSAGLGTLLRYFLGRSPAEAWRAEGRSEPFDLRVPERAR